ncbi:ParB/RepB/Spo0J family partition protein [Streptomyces sp. G-5]|uniref:ParB/RepB/Spo0J family partition protein n=1 Tax=Streptomyces sp. G-5 TaxID=2977231 RepID=UPI0021CF71BA|nr:ParB/RepB/Spo0J family partition protein [Streptomyces sp. G-5]MCU4750284.1 ParB/RepB/Spo0J family partition protein [Streptomyces sp. G-5]
MGSDSGRGRKVDINTIAPHPLNLREEDLWDSPQDREEMIESIRSVGLVQSLVVGTRDAFLQEHPELEAEVEGVDYVVLAGHRRLDALHGAEETRAPITVRDDLVPKFALTVLIENLKRRNLSVFQEAEGYRRLHVEDKLSHGEIAKMVGRSKTTITKRLRLLDLPLDAKQAVLSKALSADVAYSLQVALDDQVHRIMDVVALIQEGLDVQEAVHRVMRQDGETGSDRTDPATNSASTAPRSPQPSAVASEQTQLPSASGNEETPDVSGGPSATGNPTQTDPVVPAARAGTAAPASETGKSGDPQKTQSPDSEKATGRALADASRDRHCQSLVADYNASAPDDALVRVAASSLLHTSSTGQRRAHSWMRAANAGNAAAIPADGYRDAVLVAGDPATIVRLAYAAALAEAELLACNRTRSWDYRDHAHLDHLQHTGYRLTDWDKQQLGNQTEEATHG